MKSAGNSLVSIIIVNYNGFDYLGKCIKSIMENNYKEFEVILVDNNSSDNSISFVRKNFPSTKIIKLDKNFGFAEPNNLGAKKANGEFLLFLNNDCRVTPNFITELVNTYKNNSKIAILQSILLKSDKEIDSSGDFINEYGIPYSSKSIPAKITPIFSARGAAMMIKKDIFTELGGFDKNFFASFEDVDLGWRSWIFGYKTVIVPDSVVYHNGGHTVKKLKQEIQFHGVKNTLSLILVNFEFSYILKSLFFLCYAMIANKIFQKEILKEIETKSLPSSYQVIRGILWNLKNLNHIIKKRSFVNSHRVLSTQELINLGLIKSNITK